MFGIVLLDLPQLNLMKIDFVVALLLSTIKINERQHKLMHSIITIEYGELDLTYDRLIFEFSLLDLVIGFIEQRFYCSPLINVCS